MRPRFFDKKLGKGGSASKKEGNLCRSPTIGSLVSFNGAVFGRIHLGRNVFCMSPPGAPWLTGHSSMPNCVFNASLNELTAVLQKDK